MFSNVHWMHLIRLYTIQTFWKLQNLFQKGDKEKNIILAIWLIVCIH
jgi:hypothetical protein